MKITDKDREINDFYGTDPIAIDMLLRYGELEFVNLLHHCWENAVGDGILYFRLLEIAGFSVMGSDKFDRAEGKFDVVDFLENPTWFETTWGKQPELIITNPPYRLAREWITKSLENSQRYVCMLLKLTFLENRHNRDLIKSTPLKKILIFTSRLNIYKGGAKAMKLEYGQHSGSQTAYAWFIWDKHYKGKFDIEWLPFISKAKRERFIPLPPRRELHDSFFDENIKGEDVYANF